MLAYLTAFPDGRFDVRHSHEAGDTIIVEGVYRGTQTGPLEGPGGTIPPTGRELAVPYCDVLRVRDGKLVEHRVYWDQATFMAQLGLAPEQQPA